MNRSVAAETDKNLKNKQDVSKAVGLSMKKQNKVRGEKLAGLGGRK